MRAAARVLLRWALLPLVWLTAPLYALVARTGAGVDWCRRFGWHPVRVHFYHPVPQYESIGQHWFETPRPTPGISMEPDRFRRVLRELGRFSPECVWQENMTTPGTYHSSNGNFGYTSAAILHSMVRARGVSRIVEIGGGYSSLISLAALEANQREAGDDVSFLCIEPYPAGWLERAIGAAPVPARLLAHAAQEASLTLFEELDERSILFIDSSHVSKLGSDVNFLFLEVLPRLRPGVIVHVHDIYLPYEYPAGHFFGENKVFWNEQYLLQAFLAGNRDFEILLPGYFVQRDMAEDFAAAFPGYNADKHRLTSSFWLRRRTGTQ